MSLDTNRNAKGVVVVWGVLVVLFVYDWSTASSKVRNTTHGMAVFVLHKPWRAAAVASAAANFAAAAAAAAAARSHPNPPPS